MEYNLVGSRVCKSDICACLYQVMESHVINANHALAGVHNSARWGVAGPLAVVSTVLAPYATFMLCGCKRGHHFGPWRPWCSITFWAREPSTRCLGSWRCWLWATSFQWDELTVSDAKWQLTFGWIPSRSAREELIKHYDPRVQQWAGR